MRRARATMARFVPRRRATCAAHVLSHVERPPIVGKTVHWRLLKKTWVPNFDWRMAPYLDPAATDFNIYEVSRSRMGLFNSPYLIKAQIEAANATGPREWLAAGTLEVIGPMPGQSPGKPSPGSFSGQAHISRRRATASVSDARLISAVTSPILRSASRNCSDRRRAELRALAGKPPASARATSRSMFCKPCGTTRPNAPRWARHACGGLSARRITDLCQLTHQKIPRAPIASNCAS